MPCYSPWNAYLTEGTPEYRKAEEELIEQLKPAIHIVDYYYRVKGFPLPHSDGQSTDQYFDLYSSDHEELHRQIAHHFACDGIGFIELYDLRSVLDFNIKNHQSYDTVLSQCAGIMRAEKDVF